MAARRCRRDFRIGSANTALIGAAADLGRRLGTDRFYRIHDLGQVIVRWDAGADTMAIASATGIPEHEVSRIIAADRERRHALRVALRTTA